MLLRGAPTTTIASRSCRTAITRTMNATVGLPATPAPTTTIARVSPDDNNNKSSGGKQYATPNAATTVTTTAVSVRRVPTNNNNRNRAGRLLSWLNRCFEYEAVAGHRANNNKIRDVRTASLLRTRCVFRAMSHHEKIMTRQVLRGGRVPPLFIVHGDTFPAPAARLDWSLGWHVSARMHDAFIFGTFCMALRHV
ncbi:hypothetical protein C7446_3194 [Kushneria sinocarnis]|uniref:Uncharacterized protein n=1 Tax=Kushneria sinocarnis TaxID=595502 RepID=A0A420WSV6_9GAMM|nr:hypothetical protein C7446_3194 [Kushneria sinocarnis]